MNFSKSFNEDTILQKTFKDLVEKHSPDVLLETGTYEGDTTEYFASMEKMDIPIHIMKKQQVLVLE